jgi:purine-binding chemotaxis protein CheW
MANESDDMWRALDRSGESLATEEDYEHGYQREVRQDLERYVAFRVGVELYGLSIRQIAEITKTIDATPVPRTAEFVLGIGNVRGTVIPVVDLYRRLGLAGERIVGRFARTLIVRHADELYGLVVDAVIDVVTIAPEDLEEAPGAIAGPRGEYIRALARVGGEILIVLELATVLAAEAFIDPRVRRRKGREA